jgi:hypothetical protein
MMRKSPSSSMQKTYDECYLICSTAIYFEGQVRSASCSDACSTRQWSHPC